MKKHRLKNYLKLGILLFGISISIISCQKDDGISDLQEQSNNKTQFIIQKAINPSIIKNTNLYEKIKILNQNINFKSFDEISRNVYNQDLDITINTDLANYIEFGDYHSYTFPISRTVNNGLTENLLLSYQSDGSYLAYIVSYDISEQEKEQLLNNQNIEGIENKVSFTSLENQQIANNLLGKGIGDNTCWELVTITPTCSYSGQHTAEQIKNENVNCEQINNGGYVSPSYTVFMTTECGDGGSGGPFNPIGDNPYDGNTGGAGPTNPGEEDSTNNSDHQDCDDEMSTGFDNGSGGCITDVTIPIIVDDIGEKAECKKLTKFLTNEDNQIFKQKLQELSSNSNLDLNYEKGATMSENESEITTYQGNPDEPKFTMTALPTNKYEAFVHTHPAIGGGTLSVFSPADLIAIATFIKNDKISSSFTAYLTTKKGTQYALTIENPTKFLDFFIYKTIKNETELPSDQWQRYYNSYDLAKPILEKYFILQI